MASRTSTRIWINDEDEPRNSICLGKIKPTDKIRFEVACPGDLVPLRNHNLFNSFAEGAYYAFMVELTGEQLFQPGNNVVINLVKKLGRGQVELYTIGLTRVGVNWFFMKTALDIQFFLSGEELVSPSIHGQPELLERIKNIVKDDPGIEDFSEYQEYTPEPNTVKWFDPFRLIGAIASENGDVFFHFKDIRCGLPAHQPVFETDKVGKAYSGILLRPGHKVRFETTENTGSFKAKALWVAY